MTDLSAPLKRRSARARSGPRLPRHIPVTRIALGLLAILAIGVVARVVLVDDPDGGRPGATVDIAANTGNNSLAGAMASPSTATITADPEMFPADQVPVVSATSVSDADPLPDPAATDPELLEETEFGPIPRMSATGLRPFDAYARPVVAGDGRPRIALVVSGLGLNLDGTLEAIEALPDEVTLAFAPYGKTLDRTVGAARVGGHEIFLEVPLEPFDYPDNDPGPDTLLTGQAPRDNLQKLFHVMSRFPGYVGVINNMGARFTSSGADFAPVMEELGARGLGYLDDGSSNRSLAPQLARANRVPFARIDALVDANPAREPILAALQDLEKKALQSGSAIGIVSALPVSIEAIADWAADLAGKGIDLVPASALMGDS
ncbi:divergent polysaccharide deacetylase family protein [Devosia sp. ZB163]|uniref:divergent polysaccharide deacetylase family protein n=1 Tax=Devosia sp. ZB163 TaxID=3025938 RepID=UPI00236210D2|nr:divergent polysaccharide deacetylase family protein [Devosia sp. ZB163]MDC9822117.1 divergent polysaccharide deacetylase family protein [Devosia sp. ZB163]